MRDGDSGDSGDSSSGDGDGDGDGGGSSNTPPPLTPEQVKQFYPSLGSSTADRRHWVDIVVDWVDLSRHVLIVAPKMIKNGSMVDSILHFTTSLREIDGAGVLRPGRPFF